MMKFTNNLVVHETLQIARHQLSITGCTFNILRPACVHKVLSIWHKPCTSALSSGHYFHFLWPPSNKDSKILGK